MDTMVAMVTITMVVTMGYGWLWLIYIYISEWDIQIYTMVTMVG